MTRNLVRLAALVFVLAATFGLTLPRPALAITCGTTGDYFVNCSKRVLRPRRDHHVHPHRPRHRLH